MEISTEQATWALLDLLKTPIVGDLHANRSPGSAIEYCTREEVFRNLSSGEQRLVRFAQAVHGGVDVLEGASVAALGGLDADLRRKVWFILGARYVDRAVVSHGPALDVAAKAVCVGRSDHWDNTEDKANARQDARAAIEAYLGVFNHDRD